MCKISNFLLIHNMFWRLPADRHQPPTARLRTPRSGPRTTAVSGSLTRPAWSSGSWLFLSSPSHSSSGTRPLHGKISCFNSFQPVGRRLFAVTAHPQVDPVGSSRHEGSDRHPLPLRLPGAGPHHHRLLLLHRLQATRATAWPRPRSPSRSS